MKSSHRLYWLPKAWSEAVVERVILGCLESTKRSSFELQKMATIDLWYEVSGGHETCHQPKHHAMLAIMFRRNHPKNCIKWPTFEHVHQVWSPPPKEKTNWLTFHDPLQCNHEFFWGPPGLFSGTRVKIQEDDSGASAKSTYATSAMDVSFVLKNANGSDSEWPNKN